VIPQVLLGSAALDQPWQELAIGMHPPRQL
jgi:hypothetical protein